MNYLVDQFGSSKWAHVLVPLPRTHFSFGIQLLLDAHILPCFSTRYVWGGKLTTGGGQGFSTASQGPVASR